MRDPFDDDLLALGIEDVGRLRESPDHVVEHDQDRELEEHRQASTRRVHPVRPVERHHLLVHLLAQLLALGRRRARLRLVAVLDLLHLRREELHPHHRAGARAREGEDDDHHGDREQGDRDGIIRDKPVEEGEDVPDQNEDRVQDRTDDGRTGLGGVGGSGEEHLGPQPGTGSKPRLPNGRQRATRLSASQDPRPAPWVSTASTAYAEQEGRKWQGEGRPARSPW